MTRFSRAISRLYRFALGLLPRGTQDRYGEPMAQMFEDEWVERRGLGRVPFLIWAFVGLLATALLTRLQRRGSSKRVEIPGVGIAGSRRNSVRLRLSAWLMDASDDLRLGARGLLRRPGFTAAILVTLVLGIGLNTAVFSLVNGLLLRPLPYSDAHRLVQLSETAPGIESMDVSLPDFDLWRSRTTVFSGMFAFDDETFLLTSPNQPEILEGAVASPGFMAVLGLEPVLGRSFRTEEEIPGADRVAIISDALWDRRYGRDPNVVDQMLILDGSPRKIVGVAPPGFHFPEFAHVWVPLAFDPVRTDAENYGFDVIARLNPMSDLRAALAEGEAIAASLAEMSPATKGSIGTTAYPLRAADVPLVVGLMSVALLAAVFLVMLVACTNVASLLLARGEERRGEMAVRHALGAGTSRLVRQVLTETALLVGAGVAGAMVVAHSVVGLIPRLLPGGLPFWLRFDLDGRVLGWSAVMGAMCCAVIALPPALQAVRGHGVRASLNGRILTGGTRRWLVWSQIAFATVLVGAAGLTTRALMNLNRIKPGIDAEAVLVLSAPLPPWSYPDHAARVGFYREALGRVRSIPGVSSAATVDAVPFVSAGQEVALDGGGDPTAALPIGLLNGFSDEYFETLGIPVLEGQVPAGADAWQPIPIAVVSESLARRLWPGEQAVGRRIRHGVSGSRSPTVAPDVPWLTVVAVVGDVLQSGPGRPTRAELYVPSGYRSSGTFTMVVRTAGDPLSFAERVRQRVHEVDPAIPFYEPTTMALARRFSVWTQRMTSFLLTTFGALAMLLSVVGVYGVMAHLTRTRYREMGLRVAVGASGWEVRRLVLEDTMRLLAPGLAIGLVASGGLSLALQHVLFGVGPLDPVTLTGTVVIFLIAGLVAAYIPASRAARVDPAVALRAD